MKMYLKKVNILLLSEPRSIVALIQSEIGEGQLEKTATSKTETDSFLFLLSHVNLFTPLTLPTPAIAAEANSSSVDASGGVFAGFTMGGGGALKETTVRAMPRSICRWRMKRG